MSRMVRYGRLGELSFGDNDYTLPDDEQRAIRERNVLTLRDKGWQVETIASRLKVPREEVQATCDAHPARNRSRVDARADPGPEFPRTTRGRRRRGEAGFRTKRDPTNANRNVATRAREEV